MAQATSILRYAAAKGYFQAAKIIVASEHNVGREIMTFLPTMNLLGFATELYLKSALAQSGVSNSQLRSLGHNLISLHSHSALTGTKVSQSAKPLAYFFQLHHSDFGFRYIESDMTYDVPDYDEIFEGMDKLDNVVDEYVGASASKGLRAGH
jgi:hypothetical protein